MGQLPAEDFEETMVDCSDDAIQTAYHDVRDDKTDSNWLLCGYTSDGKALELIGSGAGGLTEMAESFVEDQPQYGYLRVTVGDEESIRQKFALIPGAARASRPSRRPRCRCTRPTSRMSSASLPSSSTTLRRARWTPRRCVSVSSRLEVPTTASTTKKAAWFLPKKKREDPC